MQFNAIDIGSSRWNFGGVNGGATFPDAFFAPSDLRIPVFSEQAPFGPAIDEFMPNPMTIEDTGFFASLLTGNGPLEHRARRREGEGPREDSRRADADDAVGPGSALPVRRRVPDPGAAGLDGITVEFKEFGVGLKFLPVVLGSGQVNLKLNISVSELTSQTTCCSRRQIRIDFLVPSLSKRSASATVELRDGQTIGIAGLINENLREVVKKFPGLGSIPVLGNLFRSQEFMKGETELVILVTPRLARPIRRIRSACRPTISSSRTAMEFYLLGRLEGKRPRGSAAAATARSAKRRRRRIGLRASHRVTRGESNMNSYKILTALVGLTVFERSGLCDRP